MDGRRPTLRKPLCRCTRCPGGQELQPGEVLDPEGAWEPVCVHSFDSYPRKGEVFVVHIVNLHTISDIKNNGR